MQLQDADYKAGSPLPDSLGRCADMLHEVRATRLEMEKMVASVKARETELKDHIIDSLSVGDDTGAAGHEYRVQVVTKPKATIAEWEAFTRWVAETGRFDCIQRRLGERAVLDMIEAGEIPPGVEKVNVKDVSLTKI